ncbi:MAG: activator of HSP90 ATPase [Acidobacteriota bacterium]
MIEPVEVTTTVAVEPTEAFRIFTEEIDAWWLDGPRHRPDPDRLGVLELQLEPGGELAENYPEGEPARFVLGRVRSFRRPRGMNAGVLHLELGGRDFVPGEWTWVSVLFEACDEGTRVRVTQGGFDALAPGHPAFHGLEGVALSSLYGLWWADLIAALRRRAGD